MTTKYAKSRWAGIRFPSRVAEDVNGSIAVAPGMWDLDNCEGPGAVIGTVISSPGFLASVVPIAVIPQSSSLPVEQIVPLSPATDPFAECTSSRVPDAEHTRRLRPYGVV